MSYILFGIIFWLVWTVVGTARFLYRLGDTAKDTFVDYILYPPVYVLAWIVGLFQR